MLSNLIDGVKAGVKQGVIDGLKEGFINLLKWVGTGILNGSYWVCIIIAISCLILYIAGYKKAGKFVGFSMLLYYILQSLKVVFI